MARKGPTIGPELPVDLGPEALQTDVKGPEDPEFYQSHRGKKSSTREYRDPPNIPVLPGMDTFGYYSEGGIQ